MPRLQAKHAPSSNEIGAWELKGVEIQRRRHRSGIQQLAVKRRISLPACLDAGRRKRSEERVDVVLATEASLGSRS